MPLVETAATAIATRVLQEAASAGALSIKRGREAREQTKAFAEVVAKAYARFEEIHPDWTAALVDASFLEHEAAPHLGRLLVPGAKISPTEIADAWADSLALKSSERRRAHVRDLEGPVADLLRFAEEELATSGAFSTVLHQQTVSQIKSDLDGVLKRLGAEQATPGTRLDYLRWVRARYSHIDPRGIHQTERSIQVPLDQVYVNLRADDGNDGTGEVDGDRGRRSEPERGVALEVALDQQAAVILGDPGSGKTTVLRYTALKHAQAQLMGTATEGSPSRPRIPILIRVADYAEGGLASPLSKYLVTWHQLAEAPSDGLADFFETTLETGEALVLLDGLDEIVDADDRRKTVRRIDDLAQRYLPLGNRFLVTSRIAGYRELPLGGAFVTYTVRPMTGDQINAFLHRWCVAVEAANPDLTPEQQMFNAQKEIDGITDAIQSAPGVERLATNPLLLTILALIHRTGASLPQKRIALYDLAVATLARTWRQAQGVPASALVDDNLLTRVLSGVAYWLHVTRASGLAAIQDLRPVVEDRWCEVEGISMDPESRPASVVSAVDAFLESVRVQTGLLVERAPDRYGFMHLTFEEYYVARELVARHRFTVERIRKHLHDPRWEEPILLALGFKGLSSPEDAASLVDAAILASGEEADGLCPSLDEDLLGRDQLFALRCVGDLVPVTRQTRNRILERAFEEVTRASGRGATWSYRIATLNALGELPSDADSFIVSLAIRDWEAGHRDVWLKSWHHFALSSATAEQLAEILDQWSSHIEGANVFGLWGVVTSGNVTPLPWLARYASDPTHPLAGECAALLSHANDDGLRELAYTCLAQRLRALAPNIVADLGAASEQTMSRLARPLLAAIREHGEALISDDEERWSADSVMYAGADSDDEFAAELREEVATGPACAAAVAATSVPHSSGGVVGAADLQAAFCTRIARLTSSEPELLDWLEMLDAELDGRELTPLTVETVEPLLDHQSARIRVAALEVLMWEDVSAPQIARVLSGELEEQSRRAFERLATNGPQQFRAAIQSYVLIRQDTPRPPRFPPYWISTCCGRSLATTPR